jgi:hypothetical protein
MTWQRPAGCESGACVEIAITDAEVLVRNSGRPDAVISFDHGEWRGFLAAAGAGEFAV